MDPRLELMINHLRKTHPVIAEALGDLRDAMLQNIEQSLAIAQRQVQLVSLLDGDAIERAIDGGDQAAYARNLRQQLRELDPN